MAREDGVYKDKGVLALVVDGQEYVVPPLSWETDFPVLVDYFALSILDPIDALMEKFDRAANKPQLQKMLVELAYRDARLNKKVDRPTDLEVKRWMDTHEGTNYTFYLQLRKKYTDINLEKVAELIGKAFLADARRRRIEAGEDDLPAKLEARDASNPKLVEIADSLRVVPPEDGVGKLDALAACGVSGEDLLAQKP